MKTKNNLLKIFLIVLLLVVSMGGIYAYWVGQVDGAKNDAAPTINIGKGVDVKTKLLVDAKSPVGNLVPAGKTDKSVGSDNAETLTIPVEIKWVEDGDQDIITADDNILGNLNVTAKVDAPYRELLDVTLNPASPMEIVADGNAVNVDVTVKFKREPANEEEYTAVAGNKLPINIEASVELNK